MAYIPDIAIPPGDTIKDMLDAEEMSQKELALRINMSEKHLSHILNGQSPITLETALKLEKIFGGSADFWITLENKYQEDKARVQESKQFQDEILIAKSFICYKELANIDFVETTNNWEEKTKNLLRFFKVSSLRNVASLYPEVSFRNAKNDLNQQSLLAWLRCGDLEAQNLELKKYSKSQLKSLIPVFKQLTSCPKNFAKELQSLCAQVGVAVVFVPYFKNTKVNGATRWIKKKKNPLIQLNTKGAASDRLWFTFFHELGHILLHEKADRFLEINNSARNSKKEQEADLFAEKTLIPKKEFSDFVNRNNFSCKDILNQSKLWKVHESIVAGRLAKHDLISWKRANKYSISLRIKKKSGL